MTALSTLFREELIRALIFSGSLILILGGGSYLALSAASPDGGAFGRTINLILTGNVNGSGAINWNTPGDGTVRNAQRLGNRAQTEYMYLTGSRTCPAGQAIYAITAAGQIQCR